MLVKTDCYAFEAAKTKKHNLVLYISNLKNVVLLIYQAQAKKKEKEKKEKEKTGSRRMPSIPSVVQSLRPTLSTGPASPKWVLRRLSTQQQQQQKNEI